MRNQYRIEFSTVYEYSANANAYVCIGNTRHYEKHELKQMENAKCTDDHDFDFEDDHGYEDSYED